MTKVTVKRSASGFPAVAFREGGEVLMSFDGNKNGGKAAAPAKHVTSPGSDDETMGANANNWVHWGINDDHPAGVVKLMRKSTVGRSGLRRITKNIYGQRLFTYKIVSYDAESNPVIQHLPIPEWEAIMRRSNFNLVRLGLYQDYAYFDINFPEIRFNGNKEKVWGIDYQKAAHTRMALMDENGYIPEVYISANFPQASKDKCQVIPVIDCIRYPDQLEAIRADYKNFKYIMPQYWPDPLNDYYPEAFWYTAKEHIEIANAIPSYKKAIYRNSASLKYDIQIPFEYLYEIYPDFKKLHTDEQDDILDEMYDEIINNLTGADNSHKAILSFYHSKDGKPGAQWIIKPIDDKMKSDVYLPEEAASGVQIQLAMMLNPALSGQGNTGGDYTGGSNNGGSNIRESGLDARSLTQADRDIAHSFFYFCRDYNGWDPEAQIGVQDMVLTTLDTGGGTKKVLS